MAFGNERTHILSTEGMINFAKASPKPRLLVATEIGIIHRLEKEAPGKRFEPVNKNAFCKYMKMITLEKLRDSLRDWKFEVKSSPRSPRARAARSSGWSRWAELVPRFAPLTLGGHARRRRACPVYLGGSAEHFRRSPSGRTARRLVVGREVGIEMVVRVLGDRVGLRRV